MIKKKKLTCTDYARKMPPLHHSIPGQPFSWENSEVIKWLMAEPHIASYIVNHIFHVLQHSGDIVYDPVTHTWRGADY